MLTKLTQLRTTNGDFARSYKYKFQITPNGAIVKTLILPADKDFSKSCLNCVLPAVGSSEIAVEVGLHTMRLNGRHETSGTISPEFILAGNYDVYNYFRAWANLGANHADDAQYANKDILSTIKIAAKSIVDVSAKVVELRNAWCRNCPEINFSDDSNDIIRFAPEIVYEFAVDANVVINASDPTLEPGV